MIFNTSTNIIKTIESEISTVPESPFRIIMFVKREFVYPIQLLFKGFTLWYRDITKFIIVILALMYFFTVLLKDMPNNQGDILLPVFLWFSTFVALIISMFSSPSSYSFCGIAQRHINSVIVTLDNANINSLQQIELIKENIIAFENRVKVRVIGLRGFLALFWTLSIYMTTKTTEFAIESKAPSSLVGYEFIAFTFVGVFVLYVGIECYAKINTLIFRAAIFGCNEYIEKNKVN